MIFLHYLKAGQAIFYGFIFAASCLVQARIPLIGDKAPSFRAKTTQGVIRFPDEFGGKWIILFSHPADFTPICQSEFMRAAQMNPEFEKLDTQLVGLSTDSKLTHDVWLKSLEREMGGRRKITFPVIADQNRCIAHAYTMIHPRTNLKQTVRSVFIIDPKGIIRAILHYPISTGRNFNEIKRLLVALQVGDKYNVITPAEWAPGGEPISTLPKKVDSQQGEQRETNQQ